MKKRAFVLFFSCLAFPDSLAAYQPFTTEDASVIPRAKGQLEMSYTFTNEGGTQEHFFLAVPGIGVADRLEFTLEIPFVLAQQDPSGWAEGVGDIRATTKILLLPEKGSRPAFAVQGYFKFDTGKDQEGLGTGEREAGFFGIVTKQIDDFAIHGMLGLDFTVSGTSKGRRAVIYGVAVDYTVGKALGRPFHVVTEVFGNTNFNPAFMFTPATWLLGAIYELSDDWTLDGGVAVGVEDASPDLTATLGATFLFP